MEGRVWWDMGGQASRRKDITGGGPEQDPQTGQMSDKCQRPRSSSSPRGRLPCAQGPPTSAAAPMKCPLNRHIPSHGQA